jgi:4-amino-4-deoxy-L-arabinose transferase-like glycosyltransferase
VAELWSRRDAIADRVVLAMMLALTGVWAFCLLDRTPDWLPALRWVLLVAAVLAAVALVIGAQRPGRTTAVLAGIAMIAGLAGPASFAVYNVAQGHSSGPGSMSGPPRPGGNGWPGGGHGHDRPNVALQKLVAATNNRWSAAAVGSWQISDLELSTGKSLMAIGGFAGADDSPTLLQFQQYVADGAVRYFIVGDHKRPFGHDAGSAAAIEQWVSECFTKSDVGGTTVYDLSKPLS